MQIDHLKKNYVVAVYNHRWGNYVKQFDNKKDAERYVDSICTDLNTYAFMYKLVSINNERKES